MRMVFQERKHPRLKKYDYSQCGCYHITICTKKRMPILSRVLPGENESQRATLILTSSGYVVERYIQRIPVVYAGVELVKYVIMPNHVHLLLVLEPHATTAIPTIVRSLKRMTNRDLGKPVWQDSFYDVIIRNEAMFQCEWLYIDGNPDKWIEDELYVDVT